MKTRADYKPSDALRMSGAIDKEIAPLVKALRAAGADTLGSCCGHGKERAYVDLAVQGMSALRTFVDSMNLLRESFADEAWFDVALNWNLEVATACCFEEFPDWIMLSLTVENLDGGGPSKELLVRIATEYQRARKNALA